MWGSGGKFIIPTLQKTRNKSHNPVWRRGKLITMRAIHRLGHISQKSVNIWILIWNFMGWTRDENLTRTGKIANAGWSWKGQWNRIPNGAWYQDNYPEWGEGNLAGAWLLRDGCSCSPLISTLALVREHMLERTGQIDSWGRSQKLKDAQAPGIITLGRGWLE